MKNYTRQGDEVYKYALRNLNLRSSKSTSSNIITVIPAGSKIQILDGAEDWYDVMYNGQKVIYIIATFQQLSIPGQMYS